MNGPAQLRDNMGLKLLSLLLALLLWLFVTGGGEGEKVIKARIVLQNLAPGLAVVGEPVERIELRLAGPRLDLAQITTGGEVIPLDLQGVRDGSITFPSPEKVLRLPSRVRVVRVSPSAVELRLVKVEAQKAP